MAFALLVLPTADSFSWVKIGFISETHYEKPNPTKFSASTVIFFFLCVVLDTMQILRLPLCSMRQIIQIIQIIQIVQIIQIIQIVQIIQIRNRSSMPDRSRP